MGMIKVPPFKKLQNDWKFWAGVIVGVSILSSVLSSLGQPSTSYEEQLLVFHDTYNGVGTPFFTTSA